MSEIFSQQQNDSVAVAVAVADNNGNGSTMDESEPVVNYDQMIARIKEFQSKLDMTEFKGKHTEMFVCSICYEIFMATDLLRDHYMKVSCIVW